ncbi:MAG: hypothetical protein M3Q45_07135 [Chloroflexota bacterium]|nr:hypothetical protein [Chloroflexota bacterium]
MDTAVETTIGGTGLAVAAGAGVLTGALGDEHAARINPKTGQTNLNWRNCMVNLFQ